MAAMETGAATELGEYEVVSVQRKRGAAASSSGSGSGLEAAQTTAGSDISSSSTGAGAGSGNQRPHDRWLLVDGAQSPAEETDGDTDDDMGDSPRGRGRGKRAVGSLLRGGGSIRRVWSRRHVAVLLLGWCMGMFFLMRWLWFYQLMVYPLQTALGDKMKAEAEPMVLVLLLVLPFVLAGVSYYGAAVTPYTSPRAAEDSGATTTPSAAAHVLRTWRRRLLPAHLDSVDVAVIAVFAVIQVNALVGKLLIDRFHGKIAKAGIMDRTARSLGMNGFYAVVLSILLVSRRSFVHQLAHLSSERAARYHIWCGNYAAITLTLHGVLYFFVWIRNGKLVDKLIPCVDCDEKQAYKRLRNFAGLVAQILFLIVALGSLERVRRRHFRRFTWSHCINTGFLAFTCIHYYPALFWLLPVMTVYVLYRLLSVFTRKTSAVLGMRTLGGNVVQLEVARDGAAASFASDFCVGQYVYIKVVAISNNEWHPVTISSSPLRNQCSFTLDVKVQGPFTRQLQEQVATNQLGAVQVDGYYGSPIEIADDMVLIAGGSGVTPFLSMLEHIWLLSQQPECDHDALPKRLWIVWATRDLAFLQAHGNLLHRIRKSSQWESHLYLHWTGATPADGGEWSDDIRECNPLSSTPGTRFSSTMDVSLAGVLTAIVVGGVLVMAVVYVWAGVAFAWWLTRLLLLFGGVLGGAAGGSWLLRRSLQRHGGFERVSLDETHEMADKTVASDKTLASVMLPAPNVLAGLDVVRSRPKLLPLLTAIHSDLRGGGGGDPASTADTSSVRVLVSGPSELHREVVTHCARLEAPFFSVETRSFAL